MSTVARTYHTHQVHYFRNRVNFDSTPTHSASRHFAGKLPAGAQVLYLAAVVKTGFRNSAGIEGTTTGLLAGTRTLTYGSDGETAANILASAGIDETATSAAMSLLGAKLTFAADTELFAKLTSAGTAATQGVAELVLAYTLPVPT